MYKEYDVPNTVTKEKLLAAIEGDNCDGFSSCINIQTCYTCIFYYEATAHEFSRRQLLIEYGVATEIITKGEGLGFLLDPFKIRATYG